MRTKKENEDLEQLTKELKLQYGLYMRKKDLANLFKFKDPRSISKMTYELDAFEDEKTIFP